MGRDHRRGIDNSVTRGLCTGAIILIDPDCIKAEGRVFHLFAGQHNIAGAALNGEQFSSDDLIFGDNDPSNRDAIGIGL